MFPETFPVTCHTDFVEFGSTYVVIQGQNQNGLVYIEKALSKGAKTIVVETGVTLTKELKEAIKVAGATLKRVANARKALAVLSAQSADYPANKLKVLAITGTKGKTTIAHVLYHLLVTAGFKTALIGTIENKISTLKESFKTPWTTPQADYLHQFFKLCVKQGTQYVVMEAAAQGETFHKLDTLEFDGAIFTNLEQEHGELYQTMEDYFQVKAAIMQRVKKGGLQLVNNDDQYGKRLVQEHNYASFGKSKSTYQIMIPEVSLKPTFLLNNHPFYYDKQFPGEYNIYNIAAAVALCLHAGISIQAIERGLYEIPTLPGRYEPYQLPNGAWAIIDYAHTPGSFEALFKTERKITDK